MKAELSCDLKANAAAAARDECDMRGEQVKAER